NKKFLLGFLAGKVVTLGGIALGLFIYKKSVVDPVENKEKFIQSNRRQANRKRIAP
ncbi:MAG: DUF3042 family protein, partial [Streptococcaceae bacterium]|nr:DUF3042 family protein [Streptococcaceae bacterium]MCL2681462.1 DUF3042 family protein [Streptococcaceae bacterium]